MVCGTNFPARASRMLLPARASHCFDVPNFSSAPSE